MRGMRSIGWRWWWQTVIVRRRRSPAITVMIDNRRCLCFVRRLEILSRRRMTPVMQMILSVWCSNPSDWEIERRLLNGRHDEPGFRRRLHHKQWKHPLVSKSWIKNAKWKWLSYWLYQRWLSCWLNQETLDASSELLIEEPAEDRLTWLLERHWLVDWKACCCRSSWFRSSSLVQCYSSQDEGIKTCCCTVPDDLHERRSCARESSTTKNLHFFPARDASFN